MGSRLGLGLGWLPFSKIVPLKTLPFFQVNGWVEYWSWNGAEEKEVNVSCWPNIWLTVWWIWICLPTDWKNNNGEGKVQGWFPFHQLTSICPGSGRTWPVVALSRWWWTCRTQRRLSHPINVHTVGALPPFLSCHAQMRGNIWLGFSWGWRDDVITSQCHGEWKNMSVVLDEH